MSVNLRVKKLMSQYHQKCPDLALQKKEILVGHTISDDLKSGSVQPRSGQIDINKPRKTIFLEMSVIKK